jgi:ssDNA-binding Zn-finger/Zn-ribbon topoisomerase 1
MTRTSRKFNIKGGKNKTLKNKGGKAISSSKSVKLNYHNKGIDCEVCEKNDYTENTGTFGKSKLRSGVGQFIFGDAADVLDTTSVIIYTCNTCGLCRIIRNKDPISITAEPI